MTFPKCVVMSSPGPLKVKVYQPQAFINPAFENIIIVQFCPGILQADRKSPLLYLFRAQKYNLSYDLQVPNIEFLNFPLGISRTLLSLPFPHVLLVYCYFIIYFVILSSFIHRHPDIFYWLRNVLEHQFYW